MMDNQESRRPNRDRRSPQQEDLGWQVGEGSGPGPTDPAQGQGDPPAASEGPPKEDEQAVPGQPSATPPARAATRQLVGPELVVQRGGAEGSALSRASVQPIAVAASSPFGSLEANAIRPRRTVHHVLRYKLTILLAAVVVAAPIVTAIWALVKPQYEAIGQIRVRPIIPHLVFRTEESGAIPFYESYLNTQLGVVRSPTVLQRVLDMPQVQATSWYKQKSFTYLGGAPSTLDRLQDDLKLQRRARAELIDVSIETPKGSDSAAIVNAVLDQYIKYVRETSYEDSDAIFRQLTEEYNALKAEIEGREKVVANLRKQLGTADPQELVARKRVRLDEMEAHLGDLRRALAISERRLKELSSGPGMSSDGEPGLQTGYHNDPEWRVLYAQLQSAVHEVEVAKLELGARHPKMLALAKNVQYAESLLRARQSQLDEQRHSNAVATLSNRGLGSSPGEKLTPTDAQLAFLKYEEKLLVEDLKEQQTAWERTFDRAQILVKEMSSISHKQELLDAVRRRLEQKRLERNVPGSIEILAKAVVPASATRDRRLLLTALALLGGFGASIFLAFLRAGKNPPISEGQELSDATAAPLLGQLPQIRAERKRLLLDDPILNEGIRMVRSPLLRQIESHGRNVLLVTGATPEDGKTTVAIMLARSLAQCGKSVLLVDADLRNPSICRRLGIEANGGFVAALTRLVEDDQLVVKTETPGLSVLPGSRVDDIVAMELIANGALQEAIARWREEYDIVLLDSAAVLPVADARILARNADGTILVARAEQTRHADVVEAMAYLNASGGTVWGTVLIGSSRARHYKYGYS